jgi:hypothetical protein
MGDWRSVTTRSDDEGDIDSSPGRWGEGLGRRSDGPQRFVPVGALRTVVSTVVSANLLRALATKRTVTDPVPVRYDEVTQTSMVLERGRWVPSWQSTQLSQTKKADMETGEDQKGQ